MSPIAEKLVDWIGIVVLMILAYFLFQNYGFLLFAVVAILFTMNVVLFHGLGKASQRIDLQQREIESLDRSLENLSLSMMDIRNKIEKDDDWDV